MRTVDRAKTRRIMESAGELFAERHYHEVRMDDIAEKAGVAKGTLYLHFKDKEAIYLGLIMDGMAELLHRIENAIEGVEGAEQKLRAFLTEVTTYCASAPYLMELFRRVETSKSREHVEELFRNRERYHVVVTDLLRGHPSAQEMSEYDLHLAVRCFGGMVQEILLHLPKPWPDDLVDRLLRLYLRGFGSWITASRADPIDSSLL